ncbi:hypothetical protein L0222_09295 [bacterium]|nr:hypothetical protein [bacterium]MCI0605199.1 hypothetical protein [bacterium]
MKKPQASLPELFEKLQQADELSVELESQLEELKKRRLIKKDTLKQLVAILDAILKEAWQSFGRKAARSGFPLLIREDQVQKRFKISQATLYRRRKTQEIPYVRDKEGVIWYPVVDLVEYYLKSRSEIRLPKTGRPRKF